MSSFDTEWTQLKQGVVRARTNLASTTVAGGAGDADLVSDKKVWNRVGRDVGGLAVNTDKAGNALKAAQEGAAATSLESAAAQQELCQSWTRYLKDLTGKCRSLQGLLEKAGKDQYDNDQDFADELARLSGRYKDTPATGGSDGGK
ncbi:hypothetical protein [Streptomyces sp. NPDC014734]|uniref:hypothetical protein n=1 Tax=Streptomyces sp. NPDC014734 TaxID=3364886 RepID=UPI0037024B7D